MDGDQMNGNGKNGFTLIEVMVAMMVLLIGMLGVMSMQYYAISGNAAARETRIATNFGHEIVEQIKGTPYSSLASGTDPAPLPTSPTISGAMQNVSRRWWVVSNCVELGGNGNLCTAAPAPTCTSKPDGAVSSPVSAVRVRTCWTDNNGTNHSVSLDSIRWDENVIP